MSARAEAVLGAFRKCYLWDSTLGRKGSVEDYQALFPGFEDFVAREYERLSSEGTAALDGLGAPSRVGPYRLERCLGRGGQGTVYVATDVRDGSVVALKVLAETGPGSERRLLRLRREAEAIAHLDHPGICRIVEAGLDGDFPYLAMRYVEGATLAERIARARNDHPELLGSVEAASALDLRTPGAEAGHGDSDAVARVALFFEKAARAVHAAHEAGLVHRDLKPANLMVTPEGDPVVLDFGLVRDAAEGATVTVTGALLGTPAYMAPEQVVRDGGRIDRRADVYSLGVSLFESLTLLHPFEAPTLEAAVRASLVQDAKDLRDLDARFPSDLALVVATAMRRHRGRRYATALALAEDLRAFRTGAPIRARAPGTFERVGNWARRHPAVAASSLVAFVTLCGGLAVSLGLLRRTHEERAAATSARAHGDDLLQFMLVDLRDRLEPIGRTDVLEAVAAKAKAYFDGLPREGLSDAERARLGLAYANLAVVFEWQGHLDAAADSAEEARALQADLRSRRPGDGEAARDLAESLACAGRIAAARGDIPRAIATLEEADAVLSSIEGPTAARRDVRLRHAACLRDLCSSRREAIRLEAAVDAGRRAVTLASAAASEDPADVAAGSRLVECRRALAAALDARGERPAARDVMREATAVARRFHAERPDEPQVQLLLAECLTFETDDALAFSDFEQATEFAAQTRDVYRRLVEHDPFNAQWRRLLAGAHLRAGRALAGRGDLTGAVADYEAGERLLEALLRTTPGNAEARRDLARLQRRLGQTLARQGQEDQATKRFESARDHLDRVVADDPRSPRARHEIAEHDFQVGEVWRYAAAGDQYAQQSTVLRGESVEPSAAARVQALSIRATSLLEEALAINRDLVAGWPAVAAYAYQRVLVLKALAEARIVRGDFERAAAAVDEAIGFKAALVEKDASYTSFPRDLAATSVYARILAGTQPPATPRDQSVLGVHFAMTGDLAHALPPLREAARDPALRRDLGRFILWQAARAAAAESAKAPEPQRAALRGEALAWLAEEVSLRREAIATIDRRLADASLPAKDRATLEETRRGHLQHVERLRTKDPAFASLRGSAEFDRAFASTPPQPGVSAAPPPAR